MDNQRVLWRFSKNVWVLGGIALVLSIFSYSASLANLILRWNTQEEYSHGYLIPLVSLFFLWEQGQILKRNNSSPLG